MKPLDDLLVVDLSRIVSGPVCTMLMGDMGATVVKVEPPPTGDDSRQWAPPRAGPVKTGQEAADRTVQTGRRLSPAGERRSTWHVF